MCLSAFYTGLHNIHVILLVNSYDNISFMHTEMFISNYNFDPINKVFRQSNPLKNFHLCLKFSKTHISGHLDL